MCSSDRKPPAPFMANLRTDMPLPRKVELLLRNVGTKIVRLQPCCGHPGEPGC